jgi:hypothetical protein
MTLKQLTPTGTHSETERLLYRQEQMILAIERLNAKCEDNMKRLNSMMLELKGVIAMVRPTARKNEWYGGKEVDVAPLKDQEITCIELKAVN